MPIVLKMCNRFSVNKKRILVSSELILSILKPSTKQKQTTLKSVNLETKFNQILI